MQNFYRTAIKKNRLLAFLFLTFAFIRLIANDFIIVNVETPGTLTISDEMRTAKNIKIVGNIDARDFKTLKEVTINTTQVLDLKDVVIKAYKGKSGCYSPITSDMFVDEKAYYYEYEDNKLPIHAFTEVRDNSITKWKEGSYSLKKIILPQNLAGFHEEALSHCVTLREIEIPENSTFLKKIDNTIYNNDLTELLCVTPTVKGGINIPATVTKIANNAFLKTKFSFIKFNSEFPPTFEKGDVDVAYIIVPNNNYDNFLKSETHILGDFSNISVNVETPGSLLSLLEEMMIKRDNIHSLKISGEINNDDLSLLLNLKNLFNLDLSDAVYNDSKNFQIKTSKICDFKLPKGKYNLIIQNMSYLNGDLYIPEGIEYAALYYISANKIIFPSSLNYITDDMLNNSGVVKLDFSKCINLSEINGIDNCYNLEEIVLPPNLTHIEGLNNNLIENIILPETLEDISGFSNLNITELVIPKSLKNINDAFNNLLFLKKADFSKCNKLEVLEGFNKCSSLTNVDLSKSPIKNIKGFGIKGANFVVSGGTKFPKLLFDRIESIKLPYTLTNFYGLFYCDSLKTINFGVCSKLENISGLHYSDNLKQVILPHSLKTIDAFSGLNDLEICVAAINPPVIENEIENINNFTLHVPNGYKGKYFMADKWSECNEIYDDGYFLDLKHEENLDLLLYSSGFYKKGQKVDLICDETLELEGINYKDFLGWIDEDTNEFIENKTQIVIDKNTTLIAKYSVEKVNLDKCDMFIDIYSESESRIYFYAGTKGDKKPIIYENDNLHAIYTDQMGSTNINIKEGYSKLYVSGDNISTLYFDRVYGDVYIQDFKFKEDSKIEYLNISVPVENINLNNANNLISLKIQSSQRSNMETIDLSNQIYLNKLFLMNTKIKELDLRDCKLITDLSISDNKIEKLYTYENLELKSLNISDNCFAFSSVNNNMYNFLTNNGNDMKSISFIIPESSWKENYILDLSNETYNFEQNGVTNIEFDKNEGYKILDNNVFSFDKSVNKYNIKLTNSAAPNLIFTSEITIPVETGIKLLEEGLKIITSGSRIDVSLDGNFKANLISPSGNIVDSAISKEGSLSLNAPNPNIYIY